MHLFDHKMKGVSLTDVYYPTKKGLLGVSMGAAAIKYGPKLVRHGAKLLHKKHKISSEANSIIAMATITAENPLKGLEYMGTAMAAELESTPAEDIPVVASADNPTPNKE